MNIAVSIKESPVEQRAFQRIPIEISSLPSSVPNGSVCNVREVRVAQELKRGDLVLVLTNGGYRPRRFLRSLGDWVWLAGDTVGELPMSQYSGNLLQVVEVYNRRTSVAIKRRTLSALVCWAWSFF